MAQESPLRTLDLFCGAGGSSWGAREAGAEIVCGIDSWKVAAETYFDNFPEAIVLNESILADSNVPRIRDVNLILASPECQHHSQARGPYPRDEAKRDSAFNVIRYVEALRPEYVVIENVPQMRGWRRYQEFLYALRKLKYFVSEQIINAEWSWVPQSRWRLFIICSRTSLIPEMAPPHTVCSQKPMTWENIIEWDRYDHKSKLLYRFGRAENTLTRTKRGIDILGEGVPFLIAYYGIKPGARLYEPPGKSLRTIPAHNRFGLITWKEKEPYLRMLQPTELRMGMGFHPNHKLPQANQVSLKLIGNAVCPPVMKNIVTHLMVGKEK